MDIDDVAFIDRETKSHMVVMARKLLFLAVDVVCFAVAVVIHKLLEALAHWVIPADWGDLESILSVGFSVAFVLIYLRLVYDMLQLFIPSLRRRPQVVAERASPLVNSTKEAG